MVREALGEETLSMPDINGPSNPHHTPHSMRLKMNALAPTNSPPDDGFNRQSTSGRTSGTYLKWTDALGWLDGDGLKPPSPLLAWKMMEFAGRWKDRQLLKEPLSKLEELNAGV